MMQMIRFARYVLVLAVLAGATPLLSGCGDGDEGTPNNQPAPPRAPVPQPQAQT